MKSINILIGPNLKYLGKFYGFWNWVYLFDDVIRSEYKIKFFTKVNDNFTQANYIVIDSRGFPNKANQVDLYQLEELKKKNPSIIWFDTRDSAGTTQFEVLPFVKKYVKKQFYKNKLIYKKLLYGGRHYTNFYHLNNNINDTDIYYQTPLDEKYIHKLHLGWNLGVSFFFDYLTYNKFDYWKEYFSFEILKKRKFEKILKPIKFRYSPKIFDISYMMNFKFSRKTVSYQRERLKLNLDKIDDLVKIGSDQRLTKKNYLKSLMHSKISIGGYGWGEICYREFEASLLGVPFIFPRMDNIDTWPNIFLDNETYLSYNLDFSDLNYKIRYLLDNSSLAKKLVENSQHLILSSYGENGQKYFYNKLKELFN